MSKIRKNGLTATVVNQGEPVIINNAQSHPLFQSEEAQKWGIYAIAGFPLKRGDEMIGAFTITYLHPHRFTDDEILLLNLFGRSGVGGGA
ncbi:MAG: GAF domain-containing protein [Chloroflexi bacterium]|nr:GAF domain-containing protein [Chloroflexota bacterium]